MPSRPLLIELSLLGLTLLLTTLPFWLTSLDITTAALFYAPGQGDSLWPEENRGLWELLYQAAPVLALVLLLGALAVLAFSGSGSGKALLRRQALFVLLSVILGPGLVVNLILKDHYGRPRPRQIEPFQGHLSYQPPGMPGVEGKSFPCGHCSVGFVVWVFYFLNRRYRPRLAYALLVLALGLGGLTGVSRMAAGAHFLSDVLWSGFLSFAVCAVLYHVLVRPWELRPSDEIPEFYLLARWQALPASTRPWVMGGITLMLVLGGMLAFPYRMQMRLDVPVEVAREGTLTIEAEVGDVLIRQAEASTSGLSGTLSYKGFGFPGSRILGQYLPATQVVRVVSEGVFTEIEGRLDLNVSTQTVKVLKVVARSGKIFLEPGVGTEWQLEASGGVVRESRLERRFKH